HDLVAHGLDHGAPTRLGGFLHDREALPDHLAGLVVTELFVKLRAAHHVGEQNRSLDFPTHGFLLRRSEAESAGLYVAIEVRHVIPRTPASVSLLGDDIRDPRRIGIAGL